MESLSVNGVMRPNSVFVTALCAFALWCSSVLHAAPFPEFEAKYKGYRYGKELGEAHLTLRHLDGDLYQLEYKSEASMFFLSDERKESSLFYWQGEHITPYKYSYLREGTGKSKALSAEFAQGANNIILANGDTLSWQGEYDNQIYRLDLQQKLAQGKKAFTYDLLNYRGQFKRYNIKVLHEEALDLPYGKLKAIKVRMSRKNSSRETLAWFAPSLNYHMVRLQQFKKGKVQGDIKLSQFQQTQP